MKTHLSALIAITAVICAPFAARADDTISFSGSLSATTCTVTGSTGGSSFTVQMGSPSASNFQDPNSVGDETPFSISLTGCTGGTATKARPFFSGTNINSAGTLDNTYDKAHGSGGATNIQLALYDEPLDSVIRLNNTRTTQSLQTPSIASGSATLLFAARYVSPLGNAGVGGFETQVTYVIDYL